MNAKDTITLFSIALFILIGLSITSCAARKTMLMQQIDSQRLKDGTYIGVDSLLLMCSVKLSVTVANGRIAEVKILKHFATSPLAGRAYRLIPERIVEEQTIDVDAVTAATVSTNNIKRAVSDALKKAQD